jgi:signal transduction histidine kinase
MHMGLMWKGLIAITMLCCWISVSGQAEEQGEQKTKDQEKVDQLNQMAFAEAQSNPNLAITRAREAIGLARNSAYTFGEATALYQLGIIYRFQGQYDLALQACDSALILTGGGQPSLEASIYSNIGICHRYKGAYEQALNSFQKSITLHRAAGNIEALGTVLNSIGVMHMSLEAYPKALEYYQEALGILKTSSNRKEMANLLNNFAIVYANQGILDSALHYFEASLAIEKELGNQKGISESINNIGAVYYYQGNYTKAIEAFQESFRMDSLLDNVQGMVVTVNNIAELYNASGNPEKAIPLLEKNIPQARLIDTKYDESVAYLNLSEAYSLQGNYEKALDAYQYYTALHDTVMGEEQTKAVAELETQFQTKEKENKIRIQHLEIEEQKAGLEARRNMILGLVAGILLLLTAAGFAYTIYRAKQASRLQNAIAAEQEKRIDAVIDATESERKRLSRELHDGVGQQLSGIKIALANYAHQHGNPEKLSNIQKVLDESAGEIRSLSHQMMPRALTELGLVPALEDMLSKSLGMADIMYQLDVVNMEERLPEKVEINLFRIAQELVNNILKHSGATQVDLQLIRTGSSLAFIVEDNGTGIKPGDMASASGHGWLNIQTRLKSIHASWDTDTQSAKGTSIHIRVPLPVYA